MAITNGYATLQDVKDRLDITDNDNDNELENVITAISRWIDQKKSRRFYAATDTRYYTPITSRLCVVDDLLSVTSVKSDENLDGTYEVTWSTSDYWLAPFNATSESQAQPYTHIERTVNGNYYFVTQPRTVEVIGSFGFSSTTPPAIKEACLIACMRVWKRRDLIFGTAGNADLGTIEAIIPLSRDGELMAMLNSIPPRITV